MKVSAVRSDKYKGMFDIVLGPCSLKADGEVSLASNETDTEWVLTFRNKCVSLEVSLDCFLHGIIVCVFHIIMSHRELSPDTIIYGEERFGHLSCYGRAMSQSTCRGNVFEDENLEIYNGYCCYHKIVA